MPRMIALVNQGSLQSNANVVDFDPVAAAYGVFDAAPAAIAA